MSNRIRFPRLIHLAISLVVVPVLTVCSADNLTNSQEDSGPVASVSVSPGNASAALGLTMQFSAVARDSSGSALPGETVEWSSSDTGVVTITASGAAYARGVGTATILALVRHRRGIATATVSGSPTAPPGTVTTLTVSATTSTSATLTFTEVGDGTGKAASYDVRYSAKPITWDSAGRVASGTCTPPLTGKAVGAGVSCTVLGLAAGTNYYFQIAAFRGALNTNAVYGALSNVAAAATSGGTGSTSPAVSAVTVAPTAASIQVGATQAVVPTARDAGGNVVTGLPVTWASDNSAVATVNASGVVIGVAVGSAGISAAIGGQTATMSITVTAAPVPAPTPVATTVTVAPNTASITAGTTQAFTATVRDQNNSPMTGQTVTWSSSNSAVATVTAAGLVTGVAAGSATITGSSGGKSGTAAITVTAPTLVPTTVTVSPSTASVSVGGTQALTATVKDQNGNAMSGQPVAWSTSTGARATVNTSGVVTGVTAGAVTITATSSGKTGTAAITVVAPTPVVTTVSLAPSSASIAVGASQTLAATVQDQNGNAMTSQTVTWSSSNTSIATVSNTGVVTGVAAGSVTITGTSSGKNGTAAITVTAVSPPPSGGGTLLLSETFENASMASRGWYDNTTPALSTVEHVDGSVSSLQFHWAQGATNPTNGGSMRHKFPASSSVYLSYYVKYSTNWVGSGQLYHPHEFHFMSSLDGDYDGPADSYMTLYIEHNYQNGGEPKLAIQDNKSINTTSGSLPNNLVASTENRSVSGCNGVVEANIPDIECFTFSTSSGYYNLKGLFGPVMFSPTPGAAGYKNNWNHVEAFFQLNTIANGKGVADGVMQYWFNGQLIIDRHDMLFRTGAHPTLQFDKFIIAPYIGDGSPVDQTMWIDNLSVATARTP